MRPGFLRGAQQAEIDQGITSQMQMLNHDADRSVDMLNQHLALIRGQFPNYGRKCAIFCARSRFGGSRIPSSPNSTNMV